MRDTQTKSDQIDLKLINIFLGLLETGSQTEVANSHGLTQPAINRSLNKLQGIYKDDLFTFDSAARRFFPTAKAMALGPELRKAHDIMKGTLNDNIDHSDFDYASSTDRFSIGMNAYAFSSQLHRLMDYIYNVSPGISIAAKFLEPGRTAKVMRQFASQLDMGDLDLILDQANEYYDDFKCQRILGDEWVVVAAETNKIGTTLTLDDYLAAKHIRCSIESYTCFKQETQPELDIALEVPSFSHVVETISKTSYLSTVPKKIAKSHSKTLRIKIYECPFETLPIDLFMYYTRDSHRANALAWLRETVLNTFNN